MSAHPPQGARPSEPSGSRGAPAPKLRAAVLSGLAWSGAGRAGQKLVTVAISIVLARLLSPADFGLIGMAMVFIGFASSLSDFGLSQALVQRPSVSEAHLRTVFSIALTLGVLLTAIFFFAARWIEGFYGMEPLAEVTRVLSTTFLLRTGSLVPRALLIRAMDFRKLATVDLVAAAAGGVIGLTLAAAGFGVWSLVAQVVADAALGTVLAYGAARWVPAGRLFDRGAFRDVIGFSANLTGFNLLNFWSRNLDNLLIGKVFGADALGLYSRAYAFMVLPIHQVNAVSGRVMTRTLSVVQEDGERHRRIYLRANRALTLVTFPLLAGLLASADSFVVGVLGPQWREMVPLLRLLSLAGLMRVVMNPLGWIYVSKGRTDRMFQWALIGTTTLMMAIVTGVLLGSVEWVARAYLAASALLLYPGLSMATRIAGFTAGSVLRAVLPNLGCALAMAAAVFGLGRLLQPVLSPLPLFSVQGVAGMLTYGALVAAFRLPAVHDLRDLVASRSRPPAS